MTLKELIEKIRADIAAKLDERNGYAEQLEQLRGEDTVDEAKVEELRGKKAALDTDIDLLNARAEDLQKELDADEAATRLQDTVAPTGATRTTTAPASPARVGQEARTYNPGNCRSGREFLLDVGRAHFGNFAARARLERHMQEEIVERGAGFLAEERAAGTGAFAGLVVPQYLTDLYAPAAKANRPFANTCNHHDLPEEGMTVNLSRITTGTSATNQSSENSGVSETNIDDTLLSIPVLTSSGQQTLSRQAIERGTGVESTMLDDLIRANSTNIDTTLLNQASVGLTNVATGVTYDDTSPTPAELYPKVIGAIAGVEGALLDQDPGDNIAVMHSRRWYWMQAVVGTSFPFVSQPGINPQNGLANLAEAYGSGVRGVLPNGTAVIVDNNVATNLGSGTNEDEIYVGSRREFHLWEDPDAPMLIRAEQPAAASLGVLFVVYSYYAYTHARYAHARKVAGTGLVTPTF